MWGVLRRFVVLLSVVAFASGMTTQAIPSTAALGLTEANAVAKAELDCPRTAMEQHSRSGPIPLPCKGIMLDCVKLMGCLGIPALLDRSVAVSVPVAYSTVAYWAPSPALSGQDIEPDLFPPIVG